MDTARLGVVYTKLFIGTLPEFGWYLAIEVVIAVLTVVAGVLLFFEDRISRRVSPTGFVGRALSYLRSITRGVP